MQLPKILQKCFNLKENQSFNVRKILICFPCEISDVDRCKCLFIPDNLVSWGRAQSKGKLSFSLLRGLDAVFLKRGSSDMKILLR